MEKFTSAEEAWFWAMKEIAAKNAGVKLPGLARVCAAEDIVKILDRLYRQRKIELAHARVLRIYGEKGTAPSANVSSELGDLRLWREAMYQMHVMLRAKGFLR